MAFSGAALLLFMGLLIAAWRVGSRLTRIEKLLVERQSRVDGAVTGANRRQARDAPPEGAFVEFLAENPTALELTRREQAEAYRQWRKHRGLTWAAR